jgi:hypothetical protein
MKATNQKELIKCKREEEWTWILLRYLNSNGCDYAIGKDCTLPTDWVDVDVFAISDSGMYSTLYIQLCLDVEPKNEGYEELRRNPKVYTFNKFGETIGAIKGKIEKYKKQGKDFSQVTLVIQTYYLTDDDEKHYIPKLREECKNIGFKAIYLLSKKGEICDGQTIQEDPERVFQII